MSAWWVSSILDFVSSQLVSGGDMSKTLDMKGREAAVQLIDVSSKYYSRTKILLMIITLENFLYFCISFAENERWLPEAGSVGSKPTESFY